MTYAVHSKLVETQDLLDMLAIYPTPAEYDNLYLFAQPHDNPTLPIVDLRDIEDMQELLTTHDFLVSQAHEGKWYLLSGEQGAFLLKERYSQETEEGEKL